MLTEHSFQLKENNSTCYSCLEQRFSNWVREKNFESLCLREQVSYIRTLTIAFKQQLYQNHHFLRLLSLQINILLQGNLAFVINLQTNQKLFK